MHASVCAAPHAFWVVLINFCLLFFRLFLVFGLIVVSSVFFIFLRERKTMKLGDKRVGKIWEGPEGRKMLKYIVWKKEVKHF